MKILLSMVSAVSIEMPMSWPSHISRSCATCFIANARPTTPSRRSSDAYGSSAITDAGTVRDRKSTRLNSSHDQISYAVFCLKKKKKHNNKHSVIQWLQH